MSEPELNAQALRVAEAVLFAAREPVSEAQIAERVNKSVGGAVDVKPLLAALETSYAARGIHLVHVAGKYTFRTAPDLSGALEVEKTVQRKLSRAAVETLSIIAYHQPVTRAEVEEIRGVQLSKGTLDVLLENDWIKPKGHRETPGRPATWVTTEQFLVQFGLDSLQDLPGLDELKAAGLLDKRPMVSAYSEEAGLPLPPVPGEEAETAADEEDEPTPQA
jgi:segregation and condensation protein B